MYDVLALAHHLRSIGVPVSTAEVSDAYQAMALVGDERSAQALAMTLVKGAQYRRALDSVAGLFRRASERDGSSADPVDGLDDEALHDFIVNALRLDDAHGIETAARALVDRHVTVHPGAPVAGTAHVMRAYRAADPAALSAALTTEVDRSGPLTGLRVRAAARQAEGRLERLRQAIEAEVRRLLVGDRGATTVARAVAASLPQDADFLTASSAELEALTDALASLPARLEQRLRRTDVRPGAGRLDARSTIRGAMAYGGVPATPVFHPRRPPRPELVVLADVSGSVATFARFTLNLAHGLHRRFRSVRSFVFIDGLDEVTDLLADVRDPRETAARIDERGLGVHLDGHSDYGRVLDVFARRHASALSPRTVVLVLGDARTNYRDPRADALRRIGRRAGRVYWLNPERRATWFDGDSAIATYAPLCSGVHECRTVRQLRDFVLHHVG